MSVDLLCPQFYEIDFVQIMAIDYGIGNYLEFAHQETQIGGSSTGPPMTLFRHFQDDLRRGVVGYVSFGYGTELETHWEPPQYINWIFTQFTPLYRANMVRIWGRKGTNLYWECFQSDRSAFKAVVRTPDRVLFKSDDLPPP